MKSQRVWADFEVKPSKPIYKISFVKFVVGGVTVYDHRELVMGTKGQGYDEFLKMFLVPGVVEIKSKKGRCFVNIFDLDKECNMCGVLVNFSEDNTTKGKNYWVADTTFCGSDGKECASGLVLRSW